MVIHCHSCALFHIVASRLHFIIHFLWMSICIVSSLWQIQIVLLEPSHTCPWSSRAKFCLVGSQESAGQVPSVCLHLY